VAQRRRSRCCRPLELRRQLAFQHHLPDHEARRFVHRVGGPAADRRLQAHVGLCFVLATLGILALLLALQLLVGQAGSDLGPGGDENRGAEQCGSEAVQGWDSHYCRVEINYTASITS
jgi:hypothetical protein